MHGATRAAARGAVRAVSRTTNDTGNAQKTTAARAARKTSVASRGGVAPTAPKTGVVARAANTQSVISNGTKIKAAAVNTSVSAECQQKYDSCMDQFCMMDNDAGGRCMCDAQKVALDKVLAEIENQNFQAYQISTYGVERVQMGDWGDGIVDEVVSAIKSQEKPKTLLDDVDVLEVNFAASSDDDLTSKVGLELYNGAMQLCVEKIPECSSDIAMLQKLYQQRIKSDCLAYDNALKQKKNDSLQKLSQAEQALREAVLEQLQTSNKYDLGQCTIEFRKCMQTTAECGEDFSKCAEIRALEVTTSRKKSRTQQKSMFKIQGATTNIEISTSTYDTLIAKKPLCESVTKSCTLVADQVWDTFLKEVAPQLKNAELIAEDKVRQGCVSNISDCFKQACKDNIDPKDPEGSYDMCLTRPGTMLSLCKVQLDTCGVDTTSESSAAKSTIWDYVLARLASMRVNACTTEVKQCLQDKDRCGADYTQCVGLDTDTIIRMCPYDKLVGCQKVYNNEDIRGDKVYDELVNMVQGIMLNIDNNLFERCQNALNESMIRVCGEAGDCKNMTTNDLLGTSSLEYKICKYKGDEKSMSILYSTCLSDLAQIPDKDLGRIDGSKEEPSSKMGPVEPYAGVIDGMIYWESVDVGADGKLVFSSEYEDTLKKDKNMSDEQRQRIKLELKLLQDNVNNVISSIEADPIVQFCMTGRDVQGMRVKQADGSMREVKVSERDDASIRFPRLTNNVRRIIANAALKKAKDNYYKKYDVLNEKMMQDYMRIAERIAYIKGENAKDVRREMARVACVALPEATSLPRTPAPTVNALGYIAAGAVAVAAVAACVALFPFTAAAGAGAGAGAGAAGAGAGAAAGAAAEAASVAALGAGTGLSSTMAMGMEVAMIETLAAGAVAGAGAGAAAGAAAAGAAVTVGSVATGVAGVAGGLAVGATLGSAMIGGGDIQQDADGKMQLDLVGSKQLNQWNYKETIVSTFDWETLQCERCSRVSNCESTSGGLFKSASCSAWADPVETCKTVQF